MYKFFGSNCYQGLLAKSGEMMQNGFEIAPHSGGVSTCCLSLEIWFLRVSERFGMIILNFEGFPVYFEIGYCAYGLTRRKF